MSPGGGPLSVLVLDFSVGFSSVFFSLGFETTPSVFVGLAEDVYMDELRKIWYIESRSDDVKA
jgi:hypothetical protein